KDVARIVAIGHSGFITFDAARWLRDADISFLQLDYDANILLCASPLRGENVRLRRAQAIVPFTNCGITITRDLLEIKISRQADVADIYNRQVSADIRAFIEQLTTASNLDILRNIEARAVVVYWNTFVSKSFPFIQKDVARVPAHWRVIGNRVSPLTNSPR